MTSWRRILEQIGGPNAVSLWSWVATIPLAILVSSTYAGAPSLAEILVWQSIVLAVHGLLGLVMWMAARTILPRCERPSRPVVALSFFALLGLLRAFLLQFAQDIVGISGGVVGERVAVNVVGTVVALAIIAIVVDDYRTDEAIVQRLESARVTLARLRDEQDASLRAADVDVLAEVQARIEDELAGAGADPTRVRAIADDIVRPLSHQLAESRPADPAVPTGETGPRARLTFGEAFGRLAAPSPVAVAVIVEVTVLGAVAVRFGPLVALANALIGGALILFGCWLIRRFLPLPRAPIVRLGALAVALAIVGMVATLVTLSILTVLVATFPASLVGVAGGTAGAGVALSLWAAVNEGRQLRQQDMAHAVAEEASEIERTGARIEQRRLQAARFLHGPIQGELVAAALRADDPEDVRRVITQRFSDYGQVRRPAPQEQVRTVIDAWSSLLDISFDADDECWLALPDASARSELLVDALSEGLTNVVRHASGPEVDIRVACREDALILTVSSRGTSSPRSVSGIGLSQLQARGAKVALASASGSTELTVTV